MLSKAVAARFCNHKFSEYYVNPFLKRKSSLFKTLGLHERNKCPLEKHTISSKKHKIREI